VGVNAKAAVVEAVRPCGPMVTEVSGGTVWTVQARCAVVWSVLPAGSVARTSKVCAPCARLEWAAGEEQFANGAASRRDSNVDLASVDVNANDAVGDAVRPYGPLVIDVSGASAAT